MGILREEYWSGLPCPPPGDLPYPGIKPRSPALQIDSLPSEPPGKPKNTGMGSLSLLQGIFCIQELNWVSYIASGFFTSWATREAQLSFTFILLTNIGCKSRKFWPQVTENPNQNDLNQWFSNFIGPSRALAQCFWFSRLWVVSRNFWQVPRWYGCCCSGDHTLKITELNK